MNPVKARPMNSKNWQPISSLPAKSDVFGLSSAERLWACSSAGLFSETEAGFQPVARLPLSGVSAVCAHGETVIVAGPPQQILRSTNDGQSWFNCRVEQVSALVTCFAASPNFSRDTTVLAGSDGDGVLRSTDGGNSWHMSNFGLDSLNLLALACAPSWEPETAPDGVTYRYELVLAATEAGVYLSPNAGRAWQFAGLGLPDAAALSLAVSPDFRRTPSLTNSHYQGSVFAGMDGAGLYRSVNGGQSWQVVSSFPAEATVNALLFDKRRRLLAGTGEHGLLVSDDLGENWLPLLGPEQVILILAEHGNRLWVGTSEGSLLSSKI